MTDTSWLTDNWPWWLAFFTLVVYEVWGLATGRRTLSRMVWASSTRYPHLIPIALSILSWLFLHFFMTFGNWAVELPWTGAIVVVIWLVYGAWKRMNERV